jgi:hypothetical protein
MRLNELEPIRNRTARGKRTVRNATLVVSCGRCRPERGTAPVAPTPSTDSWMLSESLWKHLLPKPVAPSNDKYPGNMASMIDMRLSAASGL